MSTQTSSNNNKRIAKNTLLLYIRMLLTMSVSLYTSRIVLNTLGVEDYGIYNVVGGLIIILSFLNNAMSGATQRYINIELGRGDINALKRVFNTAQIIHLIVAVAILILAETVGLWFLNEYMNISPQRMYAANWVYQFSVLTFLVGVVSVPYNAAIIAHEKMSAFACISIYEVVMKLAVVFILFISPIDKLIFYAFLLACAQISVRLIYNIYCNRHFEECGHIKFCIDKCLLKEMLSFSSWTIFGNLGFIFHTQGIAILVNIFFGATVNAAQGIANQVNSVVNQFSGNFMMAMNPQVVKTYAAGELDSMHKLVFRGSRFSFFLIMFFVIPIMIEAPVILQVWLKTVPEYTVIFVRLVLVISLLNSFSQLLATAQGATGKIKNYQIALTTIGMFHLPLTWIFYRLGFAPYYSMYVYMVIVVVLQIVRLRYVARSTGFSLSGFCGDVVCRCLGVFAVASSLPYAVHHFINSTSFITALSVCVVSTIWTIIIVWVLGMKKREREIIVKKIMIKINKL